ncbi:hypothetical protein [Deinococcus fonticola]|uniref:hypothetical protein n=1 Tax=Deinococcus fonticola TaxID=2528713 RepID=UPI001074F31E|nr:hypothetical protein [Deinococcus fonticola]
MLFTQAEIDKRIQQDYEKLLRILPFDIRNALKPEIDETEEVKIRFGRPLKIKHHGKWHTYPDLTIEQQHLTDFRARIDHIRDDNRAGIDGTGHRISRIPSADGKGTDGFNIRIARFYVGVAELLRKCVEIHPSMLIMGLAGKGKSTLLRDYIRICAEKYDANLTVVDTSNEVAGDGRTPHPGIGEADRYFVPVKAEQHKIMLEAIANNSAHLVAIDEVQTRLEAETIKDLSVKADFIATTHGDSITEIIKNKSLEPLFYPVALFKWGLVVKDIGVYELFDLQQAVKEVSEGQEPVPLETIDARMNKGGKVSKEGEEEAA